MRSIKLRSHLLPSFLAVAFVASATPVVRTHAAARHDKARLPEEEVFGEVLENGSPDTDDEYTVTISPGLPGYSDAMTASTSTNSHMWGWFDLDAGCEELVERHVGGNNRALGGPHLDTETHCTTPGIYTITISNGSTTRSVTIDYIPQMISGGVRVYSGGTPVLELYGNTWNSLGYIDEIVDTDFTSSSYSDSPSLGVDNSSGNASDVYLFDTSGSSMTWSAVSSSHMLVKLWSKRKHNGTWASSWTGQTHYYDPAIGLRALTFGGQAVSGDSLKIGAEILRPDESPGSQPAGTVATVNIAITGSEPAPQALAQPAAPPTRSLFALAESRQPTVFGFERFATMVR